MVVAEVMVPKGISGPEHRSFILIPHIIYNVLFFEGCILYILQRTMTNEHDLLVLALVLSQSIPSSKTYQKMLKGSSAYDRDICDLQVSF